MIDSSPTRQADRIPAILAQPRKQVSGPHSK